MDRKRNCQYFGGGGRSLFIESLRVLLNCELKTFAILKFSPKKENPILHVLYFRLEKISQSVLLLSLMNYAWSK